MSANVFISFASQDRKVAMTLCSALENRGFNCWISARDIQPGENFQTAIVKAIRHAKVMLLVFTANSNTSEEMTKELALASQFKVMVVPLRIEDVAPSDAFAYEFATRQWIDFFSDWEMAIQQLSRRLEYATTQPAAAAKLAASVGEVDILDEGLTPVAESAAPPPTAKVKASDPKITNLITEPAPPASAALDKRKTAGPAAPPIVESLAEEMDGPAAKKSNKGMLIAAAAVIAVLVAGGIGAAVVMGGKGKTADPAVMDVNATPATPITTPVTTLGPELPVDPAAAAATDPNAVLPGVPVEGARAPAPKRPRQGYQKVETPGGATSSGSPGGSAPAQQAPNRPAEPTVIY